MLFDPARHEPCCTTPWDPAQAREALHSIVRDTLQHRGADGQWAVHPQDEAGDTPLGGFKSLYLGSAGVLWALWWLQREGAVEDIGDLGAQMAAVHAAYLAAPDSGERVPSFYLGEVGVLLPQWRMTGDAAVAEQLHTAVQANIGNPTNEALWAAPGTMGAAWRLWQATGEARWRQLVLDNAEHIWALWQFDEAAGCHLWTQDMYGKVVQYLGAGHGFAGNANALLQVADLLDETQRDTLHARCAQTLRVMALCEDGGVNWKPGTYTPRPGGPQVLMQWCHGAPGMVTAFAGFPPHRYPEVDALLAGAGHAIWQAGPLVKGHGLCHGTAGNGEAFLVLHARTGEEVWLARARAFAMHALAQWAQARQQHGQGRYTLWTGDLGLALYLWQCLTGHAGMPSLDFL